MNIAPLTQHVIFSSIGPPMYGTSDPIYQVAMHYPPQSIHLISSDEGPEPDRGSSNDNYSLIQAHFSKMNVPVSYSEYPLEYFEDNVFLIAKLITRAYLQSPRTQIVLDISAGRGTIRQAIARAGEVAIDYIQKFHDFSVMLIYTIQSKNKPVIAYSVGRNFIPTKKDAELLQIVDQPLTQTRLAKNLGWKNQSEVSKAMQRLLDLDLIETHGHKKRVLTKVGVQVKDFIDNIIPHENS